jgi:hypothetical protein
MSKGIPRQRPEPKQRPNVSKVFSVNNHIEASDSTRSRLDVTTDSSIRQPFTKEEEEVMGLLIKAHTLFANLPETHPMEKQEWVLSFHKLQDILGSRVLRRDYPDYFKSTGDHGEG